MTRRTLGAAVAVDRRLGDAVCVARSGRDVLTVSVGVRQGGKLTTRQIHLAAVDRSLRWFADCGNPLP